MIRDTALSLLALLVLSFTACTPTANDDDDDSSPEPLPEEVEGTFRLGDATDELLVGALVSLGEQEIETDDNGRARLTLPSAANFEAIVSRDDSQDHHLVGRTDYDNFQLNSQVASRSQTEELLTALGLVADPEKGTVVVVLETIALQAAEGASAALDLVSDPPFVLVAGVPQEGSELVFEAGGSVTFPNVEPGTAVLSVTPPEGDSCLVAPGLDATDDPRSFLVAEDTTTVVHLICQ